MSGSSDTRAHTLTLAIVIESLKTARRRTFLNSNAPTTKDKCHYCACMGNITRKGKKLNCTWTSNKDNESGETVHLSFSVFERIKI